jgi:hypothetical protein
LLPRSHFAAMCCVIPASAALRAPENFVDFDLTFSHSLPALASQRILRPRRRCISNASENRLKNSMT